MYRLLFIVLLLLSSCKSEIKTIEKELTIAEKIANAHGYENWKNVSEIQFTFNVDRDTTHFERSWKWNPKTDEVIMISAKDTMVYNRNKIEDTNINADRAFVNDKYWVLFPFQLVWDASANVSGPIKAEAPISKEQLNKITLTYGDKGGYTPGDAYDVFYSNNYLIKEWVFRERNTEKPSMVNTFENYKDFNGIKIAIDHKKAEGNWNLNFSNIKVITN